MDLETENRIAAILMKEAAELRRQAEKEGVHVYLQKPNARVRPNSRFLNATVLGVQQSNRAVEVNEMWRIRQKELELDDRLKGKLKEESSHSKNRESNSSRSTSKRHSVTNDSSNASCSSSKTSYSSHSREDDGLRDEELEEFLHSRAKRGRGAVGSRMDETGPYIPRCPVSTEEQPTNSNIIEHRAVYGPEKPNSLKLCKYSEEDDDDDDDDDGRRKKRKKIHSRGSKKQQSDKKRSKDRSKAKKKKRKEKRKHCK